MGVLGSNPIVSSGDLKLGIVEQLLDPRHLSKGFICISSFNPHSNTLQ